MARKVEEVAESKQAKLWQDKLPHMSTEEEVLIKLGTSLENGLTAEQAEKSLEKYGKNALAEG